MASALLPKRRRGAKRRGAISSEPSTFVSEPRSINDLPDEILLKILSHFGPEELICDIAAVCKRWKILSMDNSFWKKASYSCDKSSDLSRIVKVRCTALLGFRSN
jgi:hypothetical protein